MLILMQGMVRRANTIAAATSLPMAQCRCVSTRTVSWEVLLERVTEAPLELDMYIYSHSDLLREIAALRDPNVVAHGVGRSASAPPAPADLGLVQIPLHTPEVPALRRQFRSLRRELMQIGIDNADGDRSSGHQRRASGERFCDRWAAVGGEVLRHQRIEEGMPSTAPACSARRSSAWRALGALTEPNLVHNIPSQPNPVCILYTYHAGAAFLQRGCPMHLRPAIWRLVLCSGADAASGAVYHQLRAEVHRYELFVDRLIAADARRMANSDDNYFLFEDTVKATLLLLARDRRMARGPTAPTPQHGLLPVRWWRHVDERVSVSVCVLAVCVGCRVCALVAAVRMLRVNASCSGEALWHQGSTAAAAAVCPPSGVLPFRGMAYYVAPLCFLYADAADVYTVFAALYTRHLRHLHAMAGDGLVRLCRLFERTLQAQHPDLFHHLAGTLGLAPLAVALPWLHRAFSGTLPPHQVLLLWDRVLGWDSLLVLPLLAVAIFAYRKHDLLAATSARQAEKLLTDCVALNSIALLQSFLFGAADCDT
eukprot:m.1481930 g.1481930  ORF g.1481930 m.1481930 type:complete len:539 (-) comp25178_c0_seq22:2789-4405(-)